MTDTGQPEEPSPGRMLRQMREAAGEDIATLSHALKVPEHKLRALEADDHDVFSDVVLMRGIAASICRHFRSNPAPVLALLPDFAPTRLVADAEWNESFQDNQQPRFTRNSDTQRHFKLGPIGIIVGLLLLAAAAVAFLPPWSGDYFGPPAKATPQMQPATKAKPAVSTVVEPVRTVPMDVPSTEAAEPQLAVPAPSDAVPAPPPQTLLPQETTPATAPVPVSEPPAASRTSEATPATLLLRAKATSWVQIRNAEGVSLVQRLLQAGESVTAPGQPPWSVVVGNAADTEVLVRGTPLDITQKVREGVARFEVK